jgi:hypothetical protein
MPGAGLSARSPRVSGSFVQHSRTAAQPHSRTETPDTATSVRRGIQPQESSLRIQPQDAAAAAASSPSSRLPTRYQVSMSPFPFTAIVPRGSQTNESLSSSYVARVIWM